MKAIIVEDEEIAVEGLRNLLKPHEGFIEVVGVAKNGGEAVTLIDSLKPDLVFLDIQIPVLNGLQVMQHISHKPRIVFTTAHDHHAVEAFELNSIDYLLKPIDKKRFEITVNRLRDLHHDAAPLQKAVIESLLKEIFPEKRISSITVKLHDRILFIPLNDITHFFANEKYDTMNTVESKHHLVDYTINTLEEKLPKEFIRISRSVIVNRSHIKEAQKLFGKKFTIILKDAKNSSVETGNKYVENFIEGFDL